MNLNPQIRDFSIGVLGTLSALKLGDYSQAAEAVAATLTAAWMARQLWISLYPAKK